MRNFLHLRAVDRVVAGGVEVLRVVRNGIPLGDVAEVAVLRIAHHGDFAKTLRFFAGVGGPGTGFQVGRVTAVGLHEVEGHHGKLQAGSALQEEGGVIVSQAHQFQAQRHGFVHDGHKILVSVADFKQRKAHSGEFANGVGRTGEDFLRKDAGAGGKVVFHGKKGWCKGRNLAGRAGSIRWGPDAVRLGARGGSGWGEPGCAGRRFLARSICRF